jgi:hypothetical protein
LKRDYAKRVSIVIVFTAAIVAIVIAPLGMEWIARVHQNWILLGNVGQAYGGVSALISAIALVGVVGSLLLQARQHSLDRLMQLRNRQAQIYAIVREDPEMYWPIIGNNYRDAQYIQRRIFRVEYFQYCAARYETGLIPEQSLRNEVFPGYFRYEENRQFWDMVKKDWLESASTKRRRRFITIANEELARAKASGVGFALPYRPDGAPKSRRRRKSRWRLPAFAGTTAVGIALLVSRRRSH